MMAKVTKSSLRDEITGLISKINNQNPFLIVGIILGFILVVYYFIFLQGKIKETTEIGGEVSNLQQSLDVTKNNIQRFSQYQDELKNLQNRLESLNKKVKTSEEIPSALENLSRAAADNGVKIEQMMPDTARGEAVLKNKEGKFIAIPIIIGARSTYHNFGKFVNVLEREGVFSSIPDFGIMVNPDDNNQHLVKLVLKIIIFEKLEKSEKPTDKNAE